MSNFIVEDRYFQSYCVVHCGLLDKYTLKELRSSEQNTLQFSVARFRSAFRGMIKTILVSIGLV